MSRGLQPQEQSISIPAYCRFVAYLGSGSYGDVAKCISDKHGGLVAVKRIKTNDNFPSIQPTTLREISILKLLSKEHCPYIVQLLDVNYDQNNIYLIFEYCSIDVEKYLKQKSFTLQQQKLFFKQLILGLQQIHAKKCMHRDIKPNNLLLCLRDDLELQKNNYQTQQGSELLNNSQSDCQQSGTSISFVQSNSIHDNDSPTTIHVQPETDILKITDFGLSRSTQYKGQISTKVVSLWYKAPELVLGTPEYGPEVDIWSAGCCLYKFMTGRTLFQVQNENELLENIVMIFGYNAMPKNGIYSKLSKFKDYDADLSIFGDDPDFVSLICGTLSVECSKRLTCEQILQSKWLEGV